MQKPMTPIFPVHPSWPTSQVRTASCAVIEESAVQPLFG
jgi:hypothetical protein